MPKLAVTVLFLLAVGSLASIAVSKSYLLIAISCAASLTVIAVGVAAGGWQAINPWGRS